MKILVLRDSKEKRSMEPRQLRLPGFTRLWNLTFRKRANVRNGWKPAVRARTHPFSRRRRIDLEPPATVKAFFEIMPTV